MLKAYFDSIPAELEEAAAIDGTTPLGALWHVVLPVSLPGLGAAGANAHSGQYVLLCLPLALTQRLITENSGTRSRLT